MRPKGNRVYFEDFFVLPWNLVFFRVSADARRIRLNFSGREIAEIVRIALTFEGSYSLMDTSKVAGIVKNLGFDSLMRSKFEVQVLRFFGHVDPSWKNFEKVQFRMNRLEF